MLQLIVEKEERLKEFTENKYAQASFFWNQLLKNKDIKVNGKRIGRDILLKKGDIVCYYLTTKQEEKRAFSILYQDENLTVVDKESGVNSEAVFSALQRTAKIDDKECYFIHRLDRNTKGLLVFARNEKAANVLLDAFKTRKIEKRYHALCFGLFEKKSALLTAYLKKDAEKSIVYIQNLPSRGAEEIVTEYTVLEEIGADMTRIEILLHTGKTHQIRAHMAHIGCPVVGDMKYGNTSKNKEKKSARQCLVAKSLRFFLEGEWSYLNEKTFISSFEAELLND